MILINKFKTIIAIIFSFTCSLLLTSIVYRFLVKIFKNTAINGHGSNLCLKEGFLPLPVHFYSPIPDIEDLEKRKVWDVRSELPGINFRIEEQKELLREISLNYSDECHWPLFPTDNPSEFYLKNQSFSYGCAASTHCMIRHVKPSTIIEIGSGMSSRIISSAIAINLAKDDVQSKYIIVDPYPTDFIKKQSNLNITEIVESRVELLNTSSFEQLKENDVLFIDSGHCVKIGGDVNYLFLEILPRLAPGVIVHIHDINIPFEYPKVYATSETFRQFWTEQYLLQSFLCFNYEFEVLMAMNYLMTEHLEYFKKILSHYNPDIHPFISSSFWIRRKIQHRR